MKVVHLVHQFPPETRGGLESYVLDLVRSQRAAGHEPLVISGSLEPGPTNREDRDEIDGVPVLRLHREDLFFDMWDKGACPEVAARIVEEVVASGADLVHLHHWIRLTQDAVSRVADAGIPVVATLHDFSASCPRAFRMRVPDDAPCELPLGVESCLHCAPRFPFQKDDEVAREIEWFRRNSRSELSRANAVLCASTSVADLVAGALDLPREGFRVLPLAYVPRFGGRRGRVAADEEPLRIAYWGNVAPRKGVGLLIEAFRRAVAARDPGSRPLALEIFGGFDRPELEAELRAAAEGLPVVFHGRFEYDRLVEAGLELAVFPSLCLETYGLVLDEAFELGLPVLVPDRGAMAERAGEGGRTFRIRDAEDLSARLLEFADDPGLRARLRAGVPEPGLDPGAHQLAVSEIYSAAIEAGPRPRRPELHPGDQERSEQAFRRAEALFRRLCETLGGG